MLMKATETRKKTTWSTWEELLLAFAVKRHGLRDWDSVAMELQNRCSIPAVITAQICKDKYHDLHRRFMNNDAADGDAEGGRVGGVGAIAIPWLEELRQLRVAELKQEVHRYDLSIQSLQLKAKRLEEREQSFRESKDVSVEPDLEDDRKEQRSENDENNGGRETSAGKDVSFSCKDSDRENRSFNESNSTENRRTGEKLGPDSVPIKPDPEAKPVWEEDSCNDSSDTHKASKRKTDADAELRDSVSESKEGTKESSDVQSSASLTERRRKRADAGGGRVTTAAASPSPPAVSTKRGGAVKPEALVGLLDIIRSHKHGQVFQRRLDSQVFNATQKTEDYKKAIRRHVDLETVQARIDDGSYSSCPTRFYLDLLLLFNNAIVFFPKSSLESTAAHQLRDLVMKELKKKKNQTTSTEPSPEPSSTKVQQPKLELERSDSLLAKHKSTAPIVVCRKRSSISGGKTATSGNKQGKLSDEKPKPPLGQKLAVKSSSSNPDEDGGSSTKLKMKEKPVTGVRSTRRSSKGNPNPSQSTAKQTGGEAAKSDKKEEVITTDKKRGAADFLKRMKKDSQGTMAVVSVKNSSDDSKASSRREQQKRKQQVTEERKDGPVRRSSGGGNGKKEVAAEESSPAKRNVGRPPKRGRDAAAAPEKRGKETSADKEDSSKRPKKRTRR
nr:ankyrin repeat, bromo and BTB domain-containing protein DDB_G0293800 [Ipomoea batatas]